MSTEALRTQPPPPPAPARPARRRSRQSRVVTSMLAQGEPLLWFTGGGLVLSCVMIVGLLALVFYQGFN